MEDREVKNIYEGATAGADLACLVESLRIGILQLQAMWGEIWSWQQSIMYRCLLAIVGNLLSLHVQNTQSPVF